MTRGVDGDDAVAGKRGEQRRQSRSVRLTPCKSTSGGPEPCSRTRTRSPVRDSARNELRASISGSANNWASVAAIFCSSVTVTTVPSPFKGYQVLGMMPKVELVIKYLILWT